MLALMSSIFVFLAFPDPRYAITTTDNNFTMLDADGVTFGGTNDIQASWDGSLNTLVNSTNFNMTMGSASNFPFFGFPMTIHHVRVFGPGSYDFDATCTTAELGAGVASCGGTPNKLLNLTVGSDQIGAHLLFDWNVTNNMDVVLLWDQQGVFTGAPGGELYQGPAGPTPGTDDIFGLVSRDVDGDGIPGAKMVDGPFIGFQPNFNVSTVPLPAAAWLFGSGLLGLVGIARRKAA